MAEMAEVDGWIGAYDNNKLAGYRRLKDVETIYVDLVDPGSEKWVVYGGLYNLNTQIPISPEFGSQEDAIEFIKGEIGV